jgi:hypothetical protein
MQAQVQARPGASRCRLGSHVQNQKGWWRREREVLLRSRLSAMLHLLRSAYSCGQLLVRCEMRRLLMTAVGHVLPIAARLKRPQHLR